MARARKAALDAELIVRKGEASPAASPMPSAPARPRGTKGTVAVTVRLDEERYHKLVGFGARFMPRKTNQDIMVEALDAYLEQVAE